jgi:hypothetical protein
VQGNRMYALNYLNNTLNRKHRSVKIYKKNTKPYYKEMVLKARKMKSKIVPFKDKIYQSGKPSESQNKTNFFFKKENKTNTRNGFYSNEGHLSREAKDLIDRLI